MRFGVLWSGGRGGRSPDAQRARFADLGIEERRIVAKMEDLPRPRAGDELVTCSLLALAKDPVTLSQLYRELMREGARLTVDGGATYTDWDAFPELLADYQKARRRKQTEAARAKAGAPPKGPRAANEEEIRKAWRDPTLPTKQAVADAFGVTWPTVNRWQKELGLGEKAKPSDD